jgi:hypothetical protein
MLGTQTASIFTRRFAENAESNVPKWIRSEAQTLNTVFVTERYFKNYSKIVLSSKKFKTSHYKRSYFIKSYLHCKLFS